MERKSFIYYIYYLIIYIIYKFCVPLFSLKVKCHMSHLRVAECLLRKRAFWDVTNRKRAFLDVTNRK